MQSKIRHSKNKKMQLPLIRFGGKKRKKNIQSCDGSSGRLKNQANIRQFACRAKGGENPKSYIDFSLVQERKSLRRQQSSETVKCEKKLERHKQASAREALASRLEYINKLETIRLRSSELEDATQSIIIKAGKAERTIRRKFGRLREYSNSIITGVQAYCLEEEREKKYKEEIRQMWMRSNR